MKPNHFTRDDIPERFRIRFWERVDVRGPDDCWNWTGAIAAGYGQYSIRIDRHRVRGFKANRFAYVMEHGETPGDLFVLHSCDNPICCNPRHLWPGTPLDNMNDMHAKRRGNYGERHHKSKLTLDQVAEIRESYIPRHPEYGQRALARKFGVYHGTIGRIIRGEFWVNC